MVRQVTSQQAVLPTRTEHVSQENKLKLTHLLSCEPAPSFADVRRLLPSSFSTKKCLKVARDISCKDLEKKLKEAPKSRQKIPSTVQVKECSWKGKDPNTTRQIKIVGVRHGLLSINRNSVPDLSRHLPMGGIERKGSLFVEQGLNTFLSAKGLPTGVDVKDQKNHPDIRLKSMKVCLNTLLLPLVLLAGVGIGLGRVAARSVRGLPMRDNTSRSFEDSLQKFSHHLPEKVEIDAHKSLPYKEAKKLDSGFKASLANDRSAYMAGYLAFISENTAGESPISFACGGAHLPRIASCLDFESRADMPESIGEKFDRGYQYAQSMAV